MAEPLIWAALSDALAQGAYKELIYNGSTRDPLGALWKQCVLAIIAAHADLLQVPPAWNS